MAMVTGGLGGLGVIASYELAMGGAPYVATTSRSGRIGAGQRELVQLQDNFRQNTVHYNVRVDGSDAAALADVFQRVQSPATHADDLAFFRDVVDDFEGGLGAAGSQELEEMEQTLSHMAETRKLLEREPSLRVPGASRERLRLDELRRQEARLVEVAGRCRELLQQRGAMPQGQGRA